MRLAINKLFTKLGNEIKLQATHFLFTFFFQTIAIEILLSGGDAGVRLIRNMLYTSLSSYITYKIDFIFYFLSFRIFVIELGMGCVMMKSFQQK